MSERPMTPANPYRIASSEISELRLLSSSDTSASSLTRDMGLLPLVVTM